MKPLKIIHSFTIDRSKWVNGSYHSGDDRSTSLLDEGGGMCCLGFLAQSCGAPKKNLLHQGTVPDPGRGATRYNKLLTDGRGEPGGAIDDFTELNDGALTPAAREKRLTTRFREQGIRVRFKGKYDPDKKRL